MDFTQKELIAQIKPSFRAKQILGWLYHQYASSYDEDLKYWSSNEHKFVLEKGTVNFFIGTSSASPVLEGKLLIK